MKETQIALVRRNESIKTYESNFKEEVKYFQARPAIQSLRLIIIIIKRGKNLAFNCRASLKMI